MKQRFSPRVREFLYYTVLLVVLGLSAWHFPNKYGEAWVTWCVVAATLALLFIGFVLVLRRQQNRQRLRGTHDAAA